MRMYAAHGLETAISGKLQWHRPESRQHPGNKTRRTGNRGEGKHLAKCVFGLYHTSIPSFLEGAVVAQHKHSIDLAALSMCCDTRPYYYRPPQQAALSGMIDYQQTMCPGK